MSDDQLKARITFFEQMVSRHFGWLESEHAFHRGDCSVRDANEPRDGAVSVRFTRTDLTIGVGLALYFDQVGLVLRDPNWISRPKPRIKSLYLEDLIAKGKKPKRPKTLEAAFENLERQLRQVASDALAPNGALFARLAAKREEGITVPWPLKSSRRTDSAGGIL